MFDGHCRILINSTYIQSLSSVCCEVWSYKPGEFAMTDFWNVMPRSLIMDKNFLVARAAEIVNTKIGGTRFLRNVFIKLHGVASQHTVSLITLFCNTLLCRIWGSHRDAKRKIHAFCDIVLCRLVSSYWTCLTVEMKKVLRFLETSLSFCRSERQNIFILSTTITTFEATGTTKTLICTK